MKPPETISVMPDVFPAVSFSTNLGQNFENVDFDYDEFLKVAREIGLSDETILNLNIDIGNLKEVAGIYYPDTKSVWLNQGDDINNFLAHELSHALDDQNGVMQLGREQKIGQRAVRLAPYVIGMQLGSISLETFGPEYLHRLGDGLNYTSLVIVLLAIALYTNDPEEIRAREIGERYENQEVITLQEK